jgi:predicted membrane metal-binding protein
LTGLGTLAWIGWHKHYGKPWFIRWLIALVLLMTPIFLAKWLAPAAWMDIRTIPGFFWYLVVLPFLLGLASFGGGLLLFIGLIIHGFFDAFGEYEWSIDWDVDDSPTFSDKYRDDWKNDWKYEFNRNTN